MDGQIGISIVTCHNSDNFVTGFSCSRNDPRMVAGKIVDRAAQQAPVLAGAKQKMLMHQKSILDMMSISDQFHQLHVPTYEECSNAYKTARGSVSEYYNKSVNVIKPVADRIRKFVQENPAQIVFYCALAAVSSGFVACFLFCLTIYACIIGSIAVGVISMLVATLSIALIATWAMLAVSVSAGMCIYVPALVYRAIRVGLVTESYDATKKLLAEDLSKAVVTAKHTVEEMANF